jgi:hypothetical protein
MITDLLTGQSNSCRILSALSFARCRRQPGGHLPFYLVVRIHMMPRGTSMLLGMTTTISSCRSFETHQCQRSYHAGETALGNQFPAAHGDFQQAFIALFTEFLINLYHELQQLTSCNLCKFIRSRDNSSKTILGICQVLQRGAV